MKKILRVLAFTFVFLFVAETSNAVSFPDVKSDAWYHDTVMIIANQGIINGYEEDGTFKPQRHLTYA